MTTALSYRFRSATASNRRGFKSTVSTTETHETVTYARGNTVLRVVTGPTRPGKEPVKAYLLRGGVFVETTFDNVIATMLSFERVAA